MCSSLKFLMMMLVNRQAQHATRNPSKLFSSYVELHGGYVRCHPSLTSAASTIIVRPNFVSPAEQVELLKDALPFLERRRYIATHFDTVISMYREAAIPAFASATSRDAVQRIHNFIHQVLGEKRPLLPCHGIDLHKDGFILPHVDSIKHSGDVVCGLSLLSTRGTSPKHELEAEIDD